MLLVLCAAMTLSLCSCNSQKEAAAATKSAENTIAAAAETTAAQEAAEASTAQAATVANSPAGSDIVISITPPDGWTPVEGTVLAAQYMKNTASFMVTHEVYFSSTDLDEIVTQAKEIFTSSFDKVEFIGDTETLTVDGNDARRFIFTCEVSGMAMKYQYIYVLVGDNVYSLLFGDLAATYDDISADSEQITADIKFG